MDLRKGCWDPKKDAIDPSGKGCWIPEKDAGFKKKMMAPRKRGRWTTRKRMVDPERDAGPQERMIAPKGRWNPERMQDPRKGCWTP